MTKWKKKKKKQSVVETFVYTPLLLLIGLAAIVGCAFVFVAGIPWIMRQLSGADDSSGDTVIFYLGVGISVIGLLIGIASAPMGYKDGTPGNLTLGAIGMAILTIGVILVAVGI